MLKLESVVVTTIDNELGGVGVSTADIPHSFGSFLLLTQYTFVCSRSSSVYMYASRITTSTRGDILYALCRNSGASGF